MNFNSKEARVGLTAVGILTLSALVLSGCDRPAAGFGPLPAPAATSTPTPTIEATPTIETTPTMAPTAIPTAVPTAVATEPMAGGIPATPEVNIRILPDYNELVVGSEGIPSHLTQMIAQGAKLVEFDKNNPDAVLAELDFRTHKIIDASRNPVIRSSSTFFASDAEGKPNTYYGLNKDGNLITTQVPENLRQQGARVIPIFDQAGNKIRVLMNGETTQILGLVNEEDGQLKMLKDPMPGAGQLTAGVFQFNANEPGVFIVTSRNDVAGRVPAEVVTPSATETLPVFSDRGTMASSDGKLIASVPNSVLDVAGIESVSIAPEKLTQMRKYMLVIWSAEMAKRPDLVQQNPTLQTFVGMTYEKPLDQILAAYDKNEALKDKGFQYDFDFGNKVKGKVNEINIKTTASEAEWNSVIDSIRKEGIAFNIVRLPTNNALKSLIYIKDGNLYIYSSYQYVTSNDIIKYKASGIYFLASLFSTPCLDGQFAIANITHTDAQVNSGKIFDILDCSTCRKDNQETGGFIITLKK